MTDLPSGTDIIHEIERALACSSDRQVSLLGQSRRVIDFLDTQRHKIERGDWSPQSFYVDRVRLAWSSDWRNADPNARRQLGQCLANLSVRIVHAEQMKNFWGQMQEVGEHLGINAKIQLATEFAGRLMGRRTQGDALPDTAPSKPSLR